MIKIYDKFNLWHVKHNQCPSKAKQLISKSLNITLVVIYLYATFKIWDAFEPAGSSENFCNIAKNFEGNFLKIYSCPNQMQN